MTFGPATPMSFARIFTPRPGRTYDRVTWPNLPVFAETLTFDRYNSYQIPTLPFLRTPNFDPRFSAKLMDVGGLGMLTVPVNHFIRAAANGLGSLMALGETEAERISRQERERIARTYGPGNTAAPGGGRVGPPAPLPPGTTKTPWQAAGDAVANIFGSGVTTPPGTEAADDTVTTATPPINTSGAPNWGLMVGLGVLVIGSGAIAWSIWGRKREANRRRRGKHSYWTVHIPYAGQGATQWHPTDSAGPFSTLSRGAFRSRKKAREWAEPRLGGLPYEPKRMRYNGRPRGSHEYVVDVSAPSHIEKITLYRDGQAVMSRFLRNIVSFRPTESQRRKIASGRGRIRITESQITGRY